ncbi:MAG: hypothetical protein HYR62_06835 [Actinobacteria bacterium]|nr:hypothetical protein [Actinomycetota bacterium]MBI3688299.1 hypothetical protein [Actinomycetota bacterium]
MTPPELLELTARLLAGPPPSMRSCWQRGCVVLTRAALEDTLAGYWNRTEPTLAGSPMRHQLLALPFYADEEVAVRARIAWSGLCRAAHHHSYELAPTTAELHGWLRDVTAVLRLLSDGKDR